MPSAFESVRIVNHSFDVIIIGGGHAGVEAAWAACRLGASTALITMDRNAIGRMSCNPAIGGLGKGQIVREIDALGGLMGLAIDRSGVQFRMLNRSKGPAVWAPRAQADRDAYPAAVQSLLAEANGLEIVEGSVEQLNTTETTTRSPRPRITSVTLADGRVIQAGAVILTTGTFLRGLMHCGNQQRDGGRVDEPAATGLSVTLEALGFELGRLKTGTPPRLHRDSIDYDQCEPQPGDDIPTPFSFMTDCITQPQINCWITWTNERVHEHIRRNLHRAPMYSGTIQSTGPRYCPSIEDKVVRFADNPKHQIFLEPEGYDNERVYCNGVSTSLPKDVQDAFIREVPGLHRARILQHGYAVEYDFVPTHQTKSSLESKRVGGLFMAGQINGTSGYEEAAGQGLVAGVNAVCAIRGDEPFVLGRDEAYIGVMIDDLITKPPTEPYRMFTSRAEYRLSLRADNADQRLTPIGRSIGMVDDDRWSRYERKRDDMKSINGVCKRGRIDGLPLQVWMRRPDATVETLADALSRVEPRIHSTATLWHVLVDAKYSGYVERQAQQIERFRRLESMVLPEGVDYQAIPELRKEAGECLAKVAPRTLGQASRLSGINPADVTVLWIYLVGRRSLPR